ncbi:MAG: HAD family phosphatase [Candidatus Marinimicrobia bacterium]|nr:HAD family phosphatase [Candidatus Neomarinimicrobiota bacterium]MBT3575639.1 HAD family phosphatase [Candidatus Neomarinimicrobiota bacterium]MBT3679878.1 HAD family phosphatase [Candidatus Neomarinimicrobiota bacterium]MBT3952036.1 HAD family phosphatase [Candidatus Neomarinimicrobiota bacterium]MBT4251927.1 HAD family phosphatase [Candidatus Neomarinimicrobiota bacterium]
MINRPDLGDIKAILFDFDGVVVQSEDVYDRATKKLGELYKVQIPAPFYEANRGIAESLFYERFKAEFDLEVDITSLQKNGKRLLWAEFSSSVHYTPGFQQFFAKIRKYVAHVALVTATPRPLIDEIFKNSNISVNFDFIVTSSDVEKTKPAPDSYLNACSQSGVDPAQALVIEDSPTGLRAATAAGCQTIAITTSCNRDSLKEANFVVDSFGELEELLTIV